MLYLFIIVVEKGAIVCLFAYFTNPKFGLLDALTLLMFCELCTASLFRGLTYKH